MSKYLKITLVLLLVILTGCGTSTQTNKVIKTKAIVEQQTGIDEISAVVDELGNVSVVGENAQSGQVTDQSNKDNSKTSSASSNSDNNTTNNNDSSNENEKPNEKPVDQDNQMINVSISIDCKTILDNQSDLKDGYESFIKNGIILSSNSYKVKKNTTVIDVLKKATSENDIKLVTVSSAFGLYVKGIGNIEEKVCGSSSGWVYKINGTFANSAASSYRLKDGDKIEWRFTCKQGDV